MKLKNILMSIYCYYYIRIRLECVEINDIINNEVNEFDKEWSKEIEV